MVNPDQTRKGNKMNKVLSPGDAMNLGDLLTAIAAKKTIKWLAGNGDIVTGELRSLVTGKDNFAMMAWGTDVRDAWVWITSNGFERTESVARLIELMEAGGCIFDDGSWK